MTLAFRCSVAAAARDEPIFATASRVLRWLLVEQESPWGTSPFPESHLGPELTAGLQAQAAALGARPLLVRRPSTGVAGNAPARRVWLVDSRPGSEGVLTRLVADVAELADLPVAGGWTRSDEPIFLVCAHGKHDTCCAVEGRPLAQALVRVAAEQTWECSHIGGDRFAPNLLVLPHGLYYGRVPVEAAEELVTASRAGRVLEPWLRGRAGFTPEAQAAQHHARERLGLLGVGDLLPLRQLATGPDTTRVVLAGGAVGAVDGGSEEANEAMREAGDAGDEGVGDVVVVVRRVVSRAAYTLTCHAAEPRPVPTFQLVDLERIPAAEPGSG